MSVARYDSQIQSGIDWLGQLPGHWSVKRLSWVFGEIGSGTTPPEDGNAYYDGEINWVTTSELREKEITSTAKQVSKEALAAFSSLRVYPPGTLLIAMYGATIGRLGWLGAPASTNQACCAFSRPIAAEPRFVYFSLQAALPALLNLSSGGGQPNINQEKLRAFRIPFPPVTEQLAISAFLDRETGKIDSLVEAQRRLIELLKEKRQAVISHAVTKGLDPTARMKDSGVEWLGKVPAHWKVVPLRAGLLERVEKNTNAANQNYLSLVAGRGVMPYAEKGDIGNKKPEDLSKCKAVHDGDIVINSMNFGIGSFGLSRYSGVCSPVYVVLHAGDGSLAIEFAAALLATKSLQTFAQSFGNGILAHRSAIGWDELKVIPIGLPSREEQSEILDHIQSVNHRAQLLLAEADAAITLLQERRAALISAAVTGKIDVRGLVPEQAEAA